MEVKGEALYKINAFEMTSAGADNYAASRVTNFNIGTANEIEVYFWVDQGNAVISVCQALLGVGQGGELYSREGALGIDHQGLFSFSINWRRQGTGSHGICINSPKGVSDETSPLWIKTSSDSDVYSRDLDFPQVFLASTFSMCLQLWSVARDLVYINEIRFHLRSTS